MIDYNFTDEQVIKALECCEKGCACTSCPLKDDYSPCSSSMAHLALSLINKQKTDLNLLKSTITHKEEEAYNKGYADAKADILEKLQAEVERAETIAKYGDDFYEGKAEGVNAALNCILSEGEE
jgi:hypothetical protein